MCRNSRQMVSLRVFSLDLALLLEPTAESQVLFTCVAPSFNFLRGIITIFFHIIERTYEEVDKNYLGRNRKFPKVSSVSVLLVNFHALRVGIFFKRGRRTGGYFCLLDSVQTMKLRKLFCAPFFLDVDLANSSAPLFVMPIYYFLW